MNYGKIKLTDVANGEGVRVSLFVSGCPHHCKGCFNAELWDYNAGEEFTHDLIFNILDFCSLDHISGLSLLGGEPLDPKNLKQVTLLCYCFKRQYPNKTIWCYTGYEWDRIKHLEIMPYIDVLVDGQFVQELKDPRLRFRGSSNQRIIDVKKSLESGRVVLRKDLME
jgi:anaerobic ribonucleoside-triphosphate reductase activating protein